MQIEALGILFFCHKKVKFCSISIFFFEILSNSFNILRTRLSVKKNIINIDYVCSVRKNFDFIKMVILISLNFFFQKKLMFFLPKIFRKLFFHVRTSSTIPSYLKWILFFTHFFQQLIISLDFYDIQTYYTEKESALRYLDYIVTGSTWIFECQNYFYQSFYIFVLHVLMIVFIIILLKKTKHNKHITPFSYLLVKVWLLYLNNFFAYFVFFVFAVALNNLIEGSQSFHSIAGFVLITIDVIFGMFSVYLSSTFLEPCRTYFKNALDIFDSRSNLLLYFTRFLIVVSNAFAKEGSNLYNSIVSAVLIIITIIIYYSRVTLSVYNSGIASFIEVFPFIGHIFVYVARMFFSTELFQSFAVYVVVGLLYANFHFSMVKKQRKHSVQFFLGCVSPGENVSAKKQMSNLSVMLRIAAFEVGTPELFEKFIKMVGVSNLRPEHILEITRFMSAFTDKEGEVLDLIKEAQSRNKSYYIGVQLHYMKKIVTSLIYGAKKKHLDDLDTVHRNYVVDMYKYWLHKSQKQYLDVFFDALRVAFNYSVLINKISYLIRRFPLDGDLRIHYADIIFIAFGEAKKSILNRRLGMKLKENNTQIENHIFMQFSKYNPYMSKHQTTSEQTDTSEATQSLTPQTTRFHFDDETITIDDSTTLAAAYVQKSKKYIAMGHVFNCIASILLLLFIYNQAIADHSQINGYYSEIKDIMSDLSNDYFDPLAGTIMPYIVMYQLNIDMENATEEICHDKYGDVYLTVMKNMNYYFLSKNMQTKLASRVFQYINQHSITPGKFCDKIRSFMSLPGDYYTQSKITVINKLKTIDEKLVQISDKFNTLYKMPLFIGVSFCVAVVCILISLLSFIISVNAKRIKEESFITEFMASKNRLVFFLLERSVDAWNILYKKYPIPSTKIDTTRVVKRAPKGRTGLRTQSSRFETVKKTLSPPPQAIKSHHINLQEKKFQVSFIGQDNYGQDSIGLMKITSPPSPRSTDNETPDMSETTTKSEIDDSMDTCSTQKDIINSAIEETEESEGKSQNWLWIIVMVIPWILVITTVICNVPPLVSRRIVENDRVSYCRHIIDQLRLLTEANYYIVYWIAGQSDEGFYDRMRNISTELSKNDTMISLEVTRQRCVTVFGSIRCYSFSEIISDIARVNRETGKQGSNYLASSLINVTVSSWELTISDEDDILKTTPVSDVVSFIVMMCIISLAVILFFSHIERIGKSSFNSLYHFPHQYFEQLEAAKKVVALRVQETDVIYVSIFTKTGEIYSISNNVSQLLNREPFDFIGKEFSGEFQRTNDQTQNTVQYTKDRKIHVLICETVSTGVLTRCALYEKLSPQSINKKETEMINSLSEYVPMKFAKRFCENNEETFSYPEATSVVFRINTETTNDQLDNFFSKLNQAVNVYPSANIIYATSNLVFIVISNNGSMENALLIRDIIEDCGKSIISMVAMKEDVKVELNIENEPSVFPSYKNQRNQMNIMLSIQPGFLGIIECPQDFFKDIGTQETYNELNYKLISFNDYITHIVDNL